MKCPKCDLETSQLNGLMSRHCKKHITEEYTRENYLEDVLTLNGKPPNYCPVCGKKTKYSREEACWDKYCSRECFYESTKGEGNPNYKNKFKELNCHECGKLFHRHESQIMTENVFCSCECNADFYAKSENVSEKKLEGRKSAGLKCSENWKKEEYKNAMSQKLKECWTDEMREQRGKEIKELWKDEEYRTKVAKAMNEAFKDHSSCKEKEMYGLVKQLYPDARHQELIGYYSYDMFVPSLDLLIEFDGTYWHGPMCPAYTTNDSIDRRKTTYIKNNRPDLRLIRIREYCWDKVDDKISYLNSQIDNHRRVILVSGPSGSGKSFICDRVSGYPVVHWDNYPNKENFTNEIVELSKTNDVVFAEIPVLVSTNHKRLVNLGFSVDLICVNESVETIRDRLESRGGHITDGVINRIARFQKLSNHATFFGTTEEILSYLRRWNLIY